MLKFNMSKTSTAFASIVCLFVFTAHAKLAKKGEASVQFFAKGTVPGLSINGKGSDLMVSDDDALDLRREAGEGEGEAALDVGRQCRGGGDADASDLDVHGTSTPAVSGLGKDQSNR